VLNLPSGATSAYPAGKPLPNTPSALTTTSCSKEDEDVLKSEYLRNPKPDKAARLEIVRKVALGEKEVQVSANIAPRHECARLANITS
jgi:hypothetical protein